MPYFMSTWSLRDPKQKWGHDPMNLGDPIVKGPWRLQVQIHPEDGQWRFPGSQNLCWAPLALGRVRRINAKFTFVGIYRGIESFQGFLGGAKWISSIHST